MPDDQEIHLIMDNYCTHKSAEVQRWLKPKRRRRFPFPLHPDQQFVVEPSGTILCVDHRPDDPPRHLPQR